MRYDFEFRSRRSNVISKRGIAASSHPLATLAGLDILRSGGSAADAAIAMSAALNVVEPFSTGIGGDCFALYWSSGKKKVYALNASGPAPRSANVDDLKKAGFDQYPLFTGHAVSVPGTVAGWDALINKFGTMSLTEVLAPAVLYAREGFPVTEWIGSGWEYVVDKLLRNSPTEEIPNHLQYNGPYQPSGNEFLIEGRPPRVGELMKLPSLADTLQAIAEHGKTYIYEGQFSEKLCKHVQKYGGWMEPSDLSGFKAEWVEPIHADYHGVRLFECPPNGQGLAAIIATKIADGFDFADMDSLQRTHILIECMRLGFAEALQWVSDPDFVDISYQELMSDTFIQSRRKLIHRDRAIKHLESGILKMGDDTVYLSVVDAEGNACSFINSLYMGGGTGLVVPGTGVLLQNRAALFSMDPEHPNVLAGGKRPYHTIIPGLITRDGELYASFGVMGGFMQPQAHLQVLSNLVDLSLNPQQALDMSRFCLSADKRGGVGADDPGGEVYIEKGLSFDAMASLRAKGHRIAPITGRGRAIFGGGQVITRHPDSGILVAGSDPRKDGCAMGW